MSIACMMHVWWNSPASGNERLILLALADEANDDGGDCHPSIRRIAAKVNCHTATVMRCIERLEGSGEIEVDRPTSYAPGRYNSYQINMSPIPSPDEIKARYSDKQAHSKMQPASLSTGETARIEAENCAHSESKLRASVRANPKNPINPKAKNNFPQAPTGQYQMRPQDPGCDGCENGWVDTDQGKVRCLPCERGESIPKAQDVPRAPTGTIKNELAAARNRLRGTA